MNIKSLLFVVFMTCCLSITRAEDSSNLISSADLVGSFPKKKILGPLGRPLGEYVTIEGRPCAVGKVGVAFQSLEDVAKFGVHSLEVYAVDGVKLKSPIIISFITNARYKPSDYYIIRGYQTGVFGPSNIDLKNPGPGPQTNYQFWIRFVPTKDLTQEKTTEKNQVPEDTARKLADPQH